MSLNKGASSSLIGINNKKLMVIDEVQDSDRDEIKNSSLNNIRFISSVPIKIREKNS